MKKKYQILIHLLFWFYFLNQQLFSVYIGKAEFAKPAEYFFSFGIFIIVFYLIYFSIPLFLRFRYKVFSILSGLVLIALLSLVVMFCDYLAYQYLFIDPKMKSSSMDWLWYFSAFRLVFIHAIYAIFIRFTIDWWEAQKLRTELQTQNQASELALLRSQMNPHFLFNTLNNIYSLVYQKSDDAPPAVMKLSSIMRYMLYDANADRVPLEKEVEYLQSFIELQKLRVRQKDYVTVNIVGNMEGKTIAPMLLIPFVENAFKHGNRSNSDKSIEVDLDVQPDKITYRVMNYIKKGDLDKDKVGGIGLTNIRRRLDLLYPEKYSLDIRQEDSIFNVQLEIRS